MWYNYKNLGLPQTNQNCIH